MNSILKLFEYVRKVSKVPIICDGEKLDTACSVVLNPSFYYKDDCKVCGRCCSASFNTVYTESGVKWIGQCPEAEFMNKDMYGDYPIPLQNRERLLESIISHEHVVNGKTVKIYESPCLTGANANHIVLPHKPKAGPRCRWMIDDVPGLYRCGIHPIRSVTCGIPHCRLNYTKESRKTSIGLGQYGRNWALGCPIDVKNCGYDLQSTKTRVHWLRVLDKCAEDLGVPTVLPEILAYVESLYPELEKGNFPDKPVEFDMSGKIIKGVVGTSAPRKLFTVR